MPIEVAYENYQESDVSKLFEGGAPEPGKASFLIGKVDINEGEKPNVTVYTTIIAHDNPEMVDRQCKHKFFPFSGKGWNRAAIFAIATDLISLDELTAMQARGENMVLPFGEEMQGRIVCGTLRERSFKGEGGESVKTVDVGFDYCSPDSEDAKKFPKAAPPLNSNKQGGATPAAPSTPPPTTAPTAATSGDKKAPF